VVNSVRSNIPRRYIQTAPNLGSQEEMTAQAIAQVRARVALQKAVVSKYNTQGEEFAEAKSWMNLLFMGFYPVVIPYTLYNIYLMMTEEHHEEQEDLPTYMKIESKPFPWRCPDCSLFDTHCWNLCKAKLEAKE